MVHSYESGTVDDAGSLLVDGALYTLGSLLSSGTFRWFGSLHSVGTIWFHGSLKVDGALGSDGHSFFMVLSRRLVHTGLVVLIDYRGSLKSNGTCLFIWFTTDFWCSLFRWFTLCSWCFQPT